ncbi:MAG: hypothetical protein ACOC0N_04995 [Chroococcales cyanobacterium]
MIISDLNHIEIVNEEQNNVQGGSFYSNPEIIPFAHAFSLANADAIGTITDTQTASQTATVSGLFSSSLSASESTSMG